MYTIGQVAEMFGLTVSTLRYYDKEGLFPDLERSSGIRRFGDKEIEALRIIGCLKSAGLEIKDIKKFMQWCWTHTKRQNFQRYLIRRKCFCAKSGARVNAGQFFRSCGTAFSKK